MTAGFFVSVFHQGFPKVPPENHLFGLSSFLQLTPHGVHLGESLCGWI